MAENRKYVPRDRSGRPIKNYRKRSDFIIKGCPRGVRVPGTTPADLEKSLKILKRQVKDTGILEDLKDRKYFEKKSSKRYRALQKAKALQRRATKRENRYWERYCWITMFDGKPMGTTKSY